MNKKFFVAWALMFMVWMIGSFIVHGTLLEPEYKQPPNLFRQDADAQQYFPLMILAHVILAGALVWIYARGAEAKPWLAQGLRFGMENLFRTVLRHKFRLRSRFFAIAYPKAKEKVQQQRPLAEERPARRLIMPDGLSVED